jgi:hypothetical protein
MASFSQDLELKLSLQTKLRWTSWNFPWFQSIDHIWSMYEIFHYNIIFFDIEQVVSLSSFLTFPEARLHPCRFWPLKHPPYRT